jgi:hypothetical protein
MFWEITSDDTIGSLVNTIYGKNMPDFEIFINNENNSIPIIDIVAPDNSDKIIEGSNVIIKTNTSNLDGCIVKVEFFVDGNSIGYNRIVPFSWVWFNASPGDHKIKAVATDRGGKIGSSSIEIKVFSN